MRKVSDMPNWCFTAAIVRSDDNCKLKSIYDKLNEWLVEDDKNKSDFGDGWIGNLAVHSGILASYDEINRIPIACRGSVEDVEFDGDSIYIAMSTAWEPMLEALYRAIERNFGLDGINIVYSAEECGNGVYLTNDDDVIGQYLVEIDDEAEREVKYAFGVVDYNMDTYSEEELIPILRRAFGMCDSDDVDIEDLVDEANEHEGITINKWEYEAIEDTF